MIKYDMIFFTNRYKYNNATLIIYTLFILRQEKQSSLLDNLSFTLRPEGGPSAFGSQCRFPLPIIRSLSFCALIS